MAIDAPTMMLLSLAIAVIAAAFLAHEWQATRDPALAFWSAGFCAVAIGSALVPLRQMGLPLLGLWLANGLLVVAHLLFLSGMARYVQRSLSRAWWMALLPWGVMLAVPAEAAHGWLYGLVNSLLVAAVALRIARMPFEAGPQDVPAQRVGCLFQAHGLFYLLKAALVFAPGAIVDITRLKGLLIQASLFEGIMIEVLLALLMAAAVRRRREDQAMALAEREPLTGLLNRRAFREQAAERLGDAGIAGSRGALMLIDVDHFKAVNDTAGHAAGDRLLLALAAMLTDRMPAGTLVARLGGDEFVALTCDLDAGGLAGTAQALRQDFAAAGAALLPFGPASGLSMGAALFEGDEDLDALLDRADAALYAAKRQGRNALVTAPADARHAERVPRASMA